MLESGRNRGPVEGGERYNYSLPYLIQNTKTRLRRYASLGRTSYEVNPVQLKELGRRSRVCEMTGREICLGGRDRRGWFFGVFNLTNHEVEHGSPRRFGLVGWPTRRRSAVGFDTSMERFIAQTSDQTIP